MASLVALVWSLKSVEVPHGTLAVSGEDIGAFHHKHHKGSSLRLGHGTMSTESVTSCSDKGCYSLERLFLFLFSDLCLDVY